MRKYVFAALLAGTVTAPAFGQVVAGPFTGARVEGIVGYDTLRSGDEEDDGVDNSEDNGDETIDGVAYGIGVGYDFDLGGAVAGIEAEYSDSSGKQDRDETLDNVNFSSNLRTGRDIYVGGRIGVNVAPTTLIYGKAGYTNTTIKGGFESDDDRFDFDGNVDGWRLGAGIEQLLGPNAYGKIEYRYSNYSKLDFRNDFDFEDFEAEDFKTDVNLDRHQVMAGIGFRF